MRTCYRLNNLSYKRYKFGGIVVTYNKISYVLVLGGVVGSSGGVDYRDDCYMSKDGYQFMSCKKTSTFGKKHSFSVDLYNGYVYVTGGYMLGVNNAPTATSDIYQGTIKCATTCYSPYIEWATVTIPGLVLFDLSAL